MWSSWYIPITVHAPAGNRHGSMVAYGVYDVVLGSHIIGGTALRGGMPLYEFISNRLFTAFENLFLHVKLSEYHTGYRAFGPEVLTRLPLGKTATILFSTTRCSPNASISGLTSEKFPAPPSISRKPPPLTSAAACNMDSECSELRFRSLLARRIVRTPIFSENGKASMLGTRTTREDCPPRPHGVNHPC